MVMSHCFPNLVRTLTMNFLPPSVMGVFWAKVTWQRRAFEFIHQELLDSFTKSLLTQNALRVPSSLPNDKPNFAHKTGRFIIYPSPNKILAQKENLYTKILKIRLLAIAFEVFSLKQTFHDDPLAILL